MPNGNEVVVIVAIAIAVGLVIWGKRPRDLPKTTEGGGSADPGSDEADPRAK